MAETHCRLVMVATLRLWSPPQRRPVSPSPLPTAAQLKHAPTTSPSYTASKPKGDRHGLHSHKSYQHGHARVHLPLARRWIFSLGADSYARLVWAASLTLAYLDKQNWQLWAIWIMAAVYISMLIPHAYCQNMGKWPTPQKGWPSFLFPTWTDAEWTAAQLWRSPI